MASHEYYMLEALKEAKKAYKKKEMPIGCVVVYNDKIIAKAHNMRERYNHVLSHAEVLALKKANKKMKCWHLEEASIYITLEPCPMCAGAIINARLKNVFFGAYNKKVAVPDLISIYLNIIFLIHKFTMKGGFWRKNVKTCYKAFLKS